MINKSSILILFGVAIVGALVFLAKYDSARVPGQITSEIPPSPESVAPISPTPTPSLPPSSTPLKTEIYSVKNTSQGWEVANSKGQVLTILLGTNKNIKLVEATALRDDGTLDLSENAKLSFEGTSTLVGNYDFPPDGDQNTSQACFFLDTDSAKTLPYPVQDIRTHFCFDDATVRYLYEHDGISGKGKASVTIDRYQISKSPVEAWDTAQVVNFKKI